QRPGQPDEDRQPGRHRVGAWYRPARQRADEESEHHGRDERREKHAWTVAETHERFRRSALRAPLSGGLTPPESPSLAFQLWVDAAALRASALSLRPCAFGLGLRSRGEQCSPRPPQATRPTGGRQFVRRLYRRTGLHKPRRAGALPLLLRAPYPNPY